MQQLGLFQGLPVVVESSRRRKRTISIYIRPSQILVKVPQRTAANHIWEALRSREHWIARQITELAERSATTPTWPLHTLLFHGQPYRLRYQQSLARDYQIEIHGETLLITGPAQTLSEPVVKEELTKWLKQLAKEDIEASVRVWSDRLNAQFQAIRVKELKSRWGSCSTKRNLNFNWRLVQAPAFVRDYVVVHELCHLQEMNHSARFWALVQHALPDYFTAKQWLKDHGFELFF